MYDLETMSLPSYIESLIWSTAEGVNLKQLHLIGTSLYFLEDQIGKTVPLKNKERTQMARRVFQKPG